MTNTHFHVIKDPVHGTMQFTSVEDTWVKPFIDSPHFQRLRHIKQLGLGDFIFPGAVHTRFNHSLGCCYVAAQIAHKVGLADEERQLVMIACLLHDIGHGPFSHAFEGLFHHKIVRHEDWTPYFLADYGSQEFFHHYNRLNPRYHLTQEKFHVIADMIRHQPVAKNVLADIVSSQLDADRLDYLLRDSHFCGVRYGEFDFRWMLHCMAIIETPDGERLGITHKGIGVIEHYLMARRLMMRNIYHAQKKLALEELLVKLLAQLAENLANNKNFTHLRTSCLGKFLLAVNQFNQQIVHLSEEEFAVLSNYKNAFLREYYPHYKDFCDYDVFSLIRELAEMKEDESCVQIAKRLHHRELPKIVRLDEGTLVTIEAELAQFRFAHRNQFHDWQLMLIKTPHRFYSGEEDPIWVVNENAEKKPIGDFSVMLKAISDQFEQVVFLCIDKTIAEDKSVKAFIKYIQGVPEINEWGYSHDYSASDSCSRSR